MVTGVATPTAVDVMVKGADLLAPAATVTETGTAATAGLLLDSVTTSPPAGARPFSVTVLLVVDLPPTTDLGESFTEAGNAGFTVRVPVFLFVPSLAVMVTRVEAPTPVVVIVNGAETVDPPATVTEAGTVATAGLELVRVIAAPPAGAEEVSVTVLATVELPPTTEAGESFSDDNATLVSEKLAERP